MKTFSIVRSRQVMHLVLFLAALIWVVFIGYLSFDAFPAFSSDIRWQWLLLLLSVFTTNFFLAVLVAAWAWLCLTAVRRGRLVFEEQGLVFESIEGFLVLLLPLWLRPFKLPYDHIREVRLGWLPSLVQITNLQGTNTTLPVSLFDRKSGEEVLVEFSKHLPAEKFRLGMEIPEVRRKVSRLNKLNAAIFISFVAAFLATFFLDPEISSRPGLIHAWQVQRREEVWNYSQDPQGNFWIVAYRDYFRVYHFSGKLDRGWKLPEDILGEQTPNQVSGDRNGNPIVWLQDGVYHYGVGGWQKIPYAQGLNLEYWRSSGVVSGEQGWTIEKPGEDAVLLKIDALTGQWSVLLLPESAVVQQLHPLSLRPAVNGDLLVRMWGAQADRVYVLSEDRWKSQEYSLTLPVGNSAHDYFLDEQDSLWLLTETKTYQSQVIKIEATGEQHSTQLPSHLGEEDGGEYYSLLVDSSSRVWVSEYFPDAITVFAPVWDGKATELMRYTYGNSNYQASSPSMPPVILPDGKIWSFDKTITTMDTRTASLPAPLPAWFDALDWDLVRLGVYVIAACLQLLLFLYSYLDAHAGKQGKWVDG